MSLDRFRRTKIVTLNREEKAYQAARAMADNHIGAVLVGPEMRGSSPVRIVRDPASFQSPAIRGLYPIGEGAGFAGGIVSAAVDGLRAAKKVVEQFAAV